MMKYYFVKTDLFGIKAGTVERFADYKAGELLVAGKIEPYDEKKHGEKPGSPKSIDAIYERRRLAYEARVAALEAERRNREEATVEAKLAVRSRADRGGSITK